jgi:PEP-CTERM motif-containing protein
MLRLSPLAAALVLVLSLPTLAHADIIGIDFDAFTEFDALGAQVPGLTFSNATVLTAGSSLNELEFPPHSGSNVIFDDGGIMSIAFDAPIISFGGYFTYLGPLTLTAYDAAHNVLGQVGSLFNSNLALSGDAGSAANEFIQFTSALGIASVTIAGDSFGGSFVMDDLTFDDGRTSESVPEPSTAALFGLALAVAGVRRQWRSRRRVVIQ